MIARPNRRFGRAFKDDLEIYEHVVLGTRVQTSAARQLGGDNALSADGPGGISLARTPGAVRRSLEELRVP